MAVEKENNPLAPMNGIIDFTMQRIMRKGFRNAGVAALGVVAFGIVGFLGAPFVVTAFVCAWFAASLIYLSGISYGIVNDLIVCRKSLPYFTLGHHSSKRGLIRSNDPNANAVAWGVLATSGLSTLAAILFGITVLILCLTGLPFAGLALLSMGLAMPFTLIGAHFYALRQKTKRKEAGKIEHNFEISKSYLSRYQRDRFKQQVTTPDEKNAWLSNSDRNLFGYLVLPLIGLAGLITTITLSALNTALPVFVFGALISTIFPFALGAFLTIGVIVGGIYLYFRHNKDTKNPAYEKYRLNYDPNYIPVPENDDDLKAENQHNLANDAPLSEEMPLLQAKQGSQSSTSSTAILASRWNQNGFLGSERTESEEVVPEGSTNSEKTNVNISL